MIEHIYDNNTVLHSIKIGSISLLLGNRRDGIIRQRCPGLLVRNSCVLRNRADHHHFQCSHWRYFQFLKHSDSQSRGGRSSGAVRRPCDPEDHPVRVRRIEHLDGVDNDLQRNARFRCARNFSSANGGKYSC